MSNTVVSITLTAKDGTKQVFDAIKRGAEQDAKALEAMGKAGASSGKQVAAGAKEGEAALRRQSDGIKQVGVGMVALGASFTMASRAAMDQGRQIDAINRLYGESADEILKLSDAIQDNTNFSNDAARQAAITGSTLASNYQISAEQIGVLIERSANLAQVHGIDLADAMSRVSGAIRGEGEAAELLGLNMSDAAVQTAAAAAGITNWTTGATEAEKAAFRYSMVLEQTNATLGAAQEAHDTTAGKVRGLINEVQDGAQAFAAWTGPVGESAAVLSDYALQTGVALAGVTQLAGGLGKLGVASKLASVAMSPAGLLGITAAAMVGVVALADAMTYDYSEAADNAKQKTDDLAESIGNLLSQGDVSGLLGQAINARMTAEIAALDTLQAKIEEVDIQLNDLGGPGSGDTEDFEATQAALLAEQEALTALAESYGGTTVAADEFAQTTAAVNAILTNTGVGAGEAEKNLQVLWDLLQSGEITWQQFQDAVQDVGSRLGEFDVAAIQATASTKTLQSSAEAARAAFAYLGPELSNVTNKYGAWIVAQGKATVETTAAMKRQEAAAYSMAAATQAAGGQITRQTDAQIAAEATMNDLEDAAYSMADAQQDVAEQTNEARDAAKAATAEMVGYATALAGTITLAAKLRPLDISVSGGDKVTGTAADMQQAGNALGGVLSIFSQLNSMSQQSAQAGSIAENLIGKPGEIGALATLLDQSRISQTRYNMTLEAGTNIAERQTEIEADLNVVRAKQLPLLDEAHARYGELIDDISHMSAEQQMATIGFMDTNKAMQANNAIALAAAAAQTELGSTARAAAQATIEGAVAADPYLEAMLTQIGLVSRDHEGNLVINFDNADELNASTDALTTAINNLTDAILSLPTLEVTETGSDHVKSQAAGVASLLNEIPKSSHTDITATDNASGTIDYVAGLMQNLNGTVANVTVQTNYVNVGDGTGMALGGMVQQSAAGGRLMGDAQRVRVNEGGMEMATLPTGDDVWLWPGSMVTPHAASKYGRQNGKAGGGGSNNFYAPVYIQANNPQQLYDALRSGRIAEAR